MTPAIKSLAITRLCTEIFENEFGTVPHLMDVTGRTAPKTSVTDTAPEVSQRLTVVINIFVERPIR
jgi:hypothetical protein